MKNIMVLLVVATAAMDASAYNVDEVIKSIDDAKKP